MRETHGLVQAARLAARRSLQRLVQHAAASSFASPISACSVGMFLSMSSGVDGVVDEGLVLRSGTGCRSRSRVKLAPMPKTTSASCTWLATRARHGDAAGAQRQRVVLGEGALALEAGRHRDLEQLGERP